MKNIFNFNKFKILFFYFVIFYISISLILYLQFPQRIPISDHLLIQFILLCFFYLFLVNCITISINGIIIIILIYQIILSFSMQGYFIYVVKSPLGYNAIDSSGYLNIAEYSRNLSLSEFFNYLQFKNFTISDYGVPFVQRIIFRLVNNVELGLKFIVLINTIVITIGSYFLYKLSLFFLDYNSSKVVVLFWGLNSYSIRINISNIKEETLTTLIIISMYYLYFFFYKKKNMYNFILLCIFIISTVFFRWFLTVFLVMIVIFNPLYSKCLKCFVPPIMILLTIIATYTGYFFSSYMNLEFLYSILSEQKNTYNLSLNMFLAFIGPLPNILNPPQQSINTVFYPIYSASKMFFSLFALYGSWYILKNGITKFYPLVLFVFFNIILTVASVTALDARFSYTMIPFYYILIIYGFNHFKFKYKNIYSLSYCLIIIGLIYFYNIR